MHSSSCLLACLVVFGTVISLGGNPVPPAAVVYTTCKEILAANPTASSGVFQLVAPSSGLNYEAYCEMGLNGGGYTFFSPEALIILTVVDIQIIFTDQTNFLMRYRDCNGNQPFAVLSQLTHYSATPLFIGLGTNTNYRSPINSDSSLLGSAYLYFGFVPVTLGTDVRYNQGLLVNGVQVSFKNCNGGGNSYIAMFPNFQECTPSNFGFTTTFTLVETLFSAFTLNPSTRLIPPEYFMFGEHQFGGTGCGFYTQTDSRLLSQCVFGVNIGIR